MMYNMHQVPFVLCSGVCPPCSEKSIQSCICSRNRDLRDCADPVWKCNEVCCASLFMLVSTDLNSEIICHDVDENFVLSE